ncbi:hypothetical protein Q8A67_023828 [Cirrhinus molitorella]|uniref:Uncharacterized protein n=1 Tax=Cirrhinus molitorella TaxID=172907 RepID=A0AA88P0K4_9TELE|nr:hypothetical protein Q8A67_023828 [Cirrhinus molitorella]
MISTKPNQPRPAWERNPSVSPSLSNPQKRTSRDRIPDKKRIEWVAKFSARVMILFHFRLLAVKSPFDDETMFRICSGPPRHHGTELEEGHVSVFGERPTPSYPEQDKIQSPRQDPEPVVTDKPLPIRVTELRIAPEPEPVTSDQVRGPATVLAMGERAMDSESVEGSSAHCTMADDELSLVESVLPALSHSSSACPELSVCPKHFVCPVSAKPFVNCLP